MKCGNELLVPGAFQQSRVVFAKQRNALSRLLRFETQIEQCGVQRCAKARRPQRPVIEKVEREVLKEQRDVIERVLIKFSLRIHRFDNLLEGTVLVILS